MNDNGFSGDEYWIRLKLVHVSAMPALTIWRSNYSIGIFILLTHFSLTGSYVSLTRSTTLSEWKLLRFDKMEVNDFELLLINAMLF